MYNRTRCFKNRTFCSKLRTLLKLIKNNVVDIMIYNENYIIEIRFVKNCKVLSLK